MAKMLGDRVGRLDRIMEHAEEPLVGAKRGVNGQSKKQGKAKKQKRSPKGKQTAGN